MFKDVPFIELLVKIFACFLKTAYDYSVDEGIPSDVEIVVSDFQEVKEMFVYKFSLFVIEFDFLTQFIDNLAIQREIRVLIFVGIKTHQRWFHGID